MMQRKDTRTGRAESRGGIIRLASFFGFLVVGVVLMGTLKDHTERLSAEQELTEAAARLYAALEEYALEQGSYPSNGDPIDETLVPDTLEPLVREGAVASAVPITSALRDEAVSIYCSPDLPTRNSDFWAVLVSRDSPDVKVLVADTDEYPGREGERLRGVYLLRGGRWVAQSI